MSTVGTVGWKEFRRSAAVTPLVVLGVLTLLGTLDAGSFGVVLPAIAQDLQVQPGPMLNAVAFATFVGLLASMGVGWWSDRHRRVPTVGAGAVLSSVAGMAQAAATGAPGIGLPRALDTTGYALSGVPLFSLLSDYYPSRLRGRVFGVVSTLAIVGPLLAAPLVALLVTGFGWRTAVIAISAPGVVVGVLALLLLREPRRGYHEKREMGIDEETARIEDRPRSFAEGWRAMFAVRTLRRLFVGAMIFGIGDISIKLYAQFFFADVYGLSTLQRGLFAIPAVLASIAGGVLGGTLMDRLARRSPSAVIRVVCLFSLLVVPAVAVFAIGPPLWLVVVANAVLSFGITLSGPALAAVYSQVVPPAVRSQALQVVNLAFMPGLLFLVLVSGPISTDYGYGAVFWMLLPFFAIGSLVMLTAADFFELDRRNARIGATADQENRRRRATGDEALLICRGVNAGYDGTQVLFGVDFEVQPGEVVALLGTNGAGKSTLLRAISGSLQASDGAILFDGENVTHKPPHEITRLGVVHMPGGRGVFPGLTVEENLRLGTWLADTAHEPRLLAEAYEVFPVLRSRRSQPAGLLSGGEQQMLSLAQAFLARPRLLLIDELSLGLTPAVVAQLLDIIRQIHARGTAIVVVEQSVNVALSIAERAVFMEKGEVKFSGATADLMQRPDILRAVYVKGTGGLTATGAPATLALRRRALDAAAERRPLLSAEGIVKHFGGVTALDGASLTLHDGEILGIVGPNGSGKTTLFDIISGYQSADSGAVVYDGVDITALPAHERARRKLVRRFQDARLFPSLTVFETLLVSLDMRLEVHSAALGAAALPPARRAERRVRLRAERLIELLELGAYGDKFVKELSTGVRRIVDLAVALALEPMVLLLDEPSSGIAQAEAEGLGPLIKRIRFETGCSILVIEHDIPLITAVSDELVAMVSGRVLLRGSAQTVLDDPRVVEAFLGDSHAAVHRSGSLVP
jgi:branched-chain amino acid transport system ATP-binding protein